MSQAETTKAVAAEERTEEARFFVRRSQNSHPTQVHGRGEDSHRIGGVPLRGDRQRSVPVGGDQASARRSIIVPPFAFRWYLSSSFVEIYPPPRTVPPSLRCGSVVYRPTEVSRFP